LQKRPLILRSLLIEATPYAQVEKAEMKVDEARSEAAMALHTAHQDASMGSSARLRGAQAHEQHALQVLSQVSGWLH